MIRDHIQGKAWKFGSNVSTDSIAPGRLISLRANPPEYAKHLLEDTRPEFIKNVKKTILSWPIKTLVAVPAARSHR